MNDLTQTNFQEVLTLIKEARFKALKSVNKQLIKLYWSVGEYISNKVDAEEWGKNTIESLSEFIQEEQPTIKGFSARNLWRMKQFYETYKNNEILSALLAEISWTNNLMIMSKTKSPEERKFYLELAIREKYSSRELERQLDSCYYERFLTTKGKLSPTLIDAHPQVETLFKDQYLFDFLNLPDNHTEGEFQQGIIQNLKRFILEMGKDFCFVGEEYRLQVGTHDYYIDLLFYHRELCCLVAIELKLDEFKPDYLGKLNFYLEALDRDVKKDHEKPSIGILLCRSKDDVVVEYALSRSVSPTMIAEYQTKLIDKQLLHDKVQSLLEETPD